MSIFSLKASVIYDLRIIFSLKNYSILRLISRYELNSQLIYLFTILFSEYLHLSWKESTLKYYQYIVVHSHKLAI